MRGKIRTRRWDDPPEPGDGFRLLVTRFRPRGLRKQAETWDAWMPSLGPSSHLHALAYKKVGQGLPWSAYRTRYLLEMRDQREAIAALARRVAAGETVTLLCSSQCVQESRCHRSLLRELIERQVEAMEAGLP